MDKEAKLKIEYMPIDKLKPYEKNARKHTDFDVDATAASIEEFGFKDPIAIWSEQNIIVEGHGAVVCSGFEEAKQTLLWYLGENDGH